MKGFFISITFNPEHSNFNSNYMQELINRLMAQGLTEQQAYKAIEVIKDFAKEKFPIFSGAIEKMFDKYKPKDDDDFLE
jgi:ribosomal protein S7